MSAELREFVAEVVDDMIADLLARVIDGHTMTKEEATATLMQLQKDRAQLKLSTRTPAGQA